MVKKIATIASLALASVIAFTGCAGSTNPSLSGSYWHENPNTNTVNTLYEKIEYNVNFVHTTLFSSSEVKNNNLNFEVKEGSSYTTELYSSDDNSYYVYKTSLTVNGVYTYGEGLTHEVKGDVTTTETHFKGLNENLRPIKSVHYARNTIPTVMMPTSKEQFVTKGYTSTTEYGETAKVTVTPDDDSDDAFNFNKNPLDHKKYNKNDYIDSDMLLMYFRAFDFGENFSYAFSSVDALSESLQQLTCSYIVNTSGEAQGVTPITLNEYYEISPSGIHQPSKKEFTTSGVRFSTSGEYSQIFLYAYYATNPKGENGNDLNNDERHRPVRIYRASIFNMGYFEYTIKSVSTVKD